VCVCVCVCEYVGMFTNNVELN